MPVGLLAYRAGTIGQRPPRAHTGPAPPAGTFPEQILALNPLHYWRLSGAVVEPEPGEELFQEVITLARDQKAATADPVDALMSLAGSSNRVVLDLIAHAITALPTSDLHSDILAPTGVAASLTQISIGNLTVGSARTTARILRLLEATMPVNEAYTIRADFEGLMLVFRQIVVLEGANQILHAAPAGNTAATATAVTVTVPRPSGTFPAGSLVYAVCADGTGGQSFTVTGHATKARENVVGWTGGQGFCFAKGTLGKPAEAPKVFTERYIAAADRKGTLVDPVDATGVVIPSGENRVLLDLITHSFALADGGDILTDVLGPGGVAVGLTNIVDVRSGVGGTCEIWRLLESSMPAAGSYTLRADFGVLTDAAREVVVLENANQTLTDNGVSGANVSTLAVSVTRASGQFPIGSKIYAICTHGGVATFASVTGDAILVRQDVTGWSGGNGHCFAKGTLTTAKSPVTVTFNLSAAEVRVSAAIVVVEPLGVVEALQPVTIVGDRFYSNGKPYFPTTHFLWDIDAEEFSQVYFSDEITDTHRHLLYTRLKNAGFNSIYLYTLNEGDYGGLVVSPYTNGAFSGAFNAAKLARWRQHLQMMIADGIRPILWTRSDDSPAINSITEANYKLYLDRIVQEFDDLPIMWVLGLEADEYWTLAVSDNRGSYLASIASQPVGIHQLNDQTNFMTSSWVQFGMYQEPPANTSIQHYDGVVAARAAVGNKPLVFSEYQQQNNDGLTTLAQQHGLAGAFAGAAGYGNGGPPGLAAFMEDLPSGMTPSRVGDVLTLTGSGVTATADISDLTFGSTGSVAAVSSVSVTFTVPVATSRLAAAAVVVEPAP